MDLFELVSSLYTTISLDYLFMGNQCPPPLPPIDMGMGYGYGPSTSGLSSTGSTAGSTEMETTKAGSTMMEMTTAGSMETTTKGSTMMETTTTIDMESTTATFSSPGLQMCISACMGPMAPPPMPNMRHETTAT